MSEKTKVSVIIPVYKTQAYLARCVQSILCQTMKNWEIILVDDGSPDDCPAICDGYGAKDPRIHVIHQPNRGLSGARNAALDWMAAHSDSGWLTFLDSDDWLHPETLEVLLKEAGEKQVGISVCGFGETTGAAPEILPEDMEGKLWTSRDFYDQLYVNATIACGKLYRRECFESLRFPEGKLNEDEFLTYRILFAEEKLVYIPAPLYAYYSNPQSITKSVWRPKRMDAFEAMEQQIAFFRGRGDQRLADACLHRYMRNAYGQMMELRQSGGDYPKEEKIIRDLAKSLLRECRRRDCVCFETDFCVLTEFYPVRTRLHLYYLAALRRLKIKPEG